MFVSEIPEERYIQINKYINKYSSVIIIVNAQKKKWTKEAIPAKSRMMDCSMCRKNKIKFFFSYCKFFFLSWNNALFSFSFASLFS